MFEFNGRQYATDKHEYLANFDEWSPELAMYIAELEGIELTDAHWEVVTFVRDFYQEFDTSPAMRVLVKAIGQRLGKDKANSIYLYRLFPKGPAKQATRIAGLPKPAKCI
ncbi:TusE/DsrC/DsvC family sulfur relay protein [Pseudidiomarina sp. 1APP75-32.1]|uniref:Sulfurtransferase n=1 Tax=Pseudidiomarina terrestris TaxID=2820060 RepID=A0AAW7QV08_9GAMM|nr:MULTISPECIES: TusE/DsrC/DsvC family sulfur relay protein [unclassified Pseudidiomarina]MDN7123733.1 TusE/DsrC/DsvC family sulfur relay protein [Pseudidiomarina sp. 1APP75-32.1]MDN7126453.1 TusE/DsrC/DsvC family sulfur relay protein [Pseudidiomarina sp. 1APR75-33.1]MDN7128543.1 TusE/DsrC/DsvC family sulfur relay protein [Pseudidiomarina sp. 1APR75-15]MDN7137871.1 TusE/DsrC/DsvC family sulfur relay protein [Pseudidiomarina sp. 1ASP75-14]